LYQAIHPIKAVRVFGSGFAASWVSVSDIGTDRNRIISEAS
jgi:hypothetical protein